MTLVNDGFSGHRVFVPPRCPIATGSRVVEDPNISSIAVCFHEIIESAVDDVLIEINFVCAGAIDGLWRQMGTIKDIADPIPSVHENPSIEFRIDIELATLKATTYAAVTFHVIEGPLQDSIHEQTILDRQSVRIQLGIYLRIVVTERAVLYQDIRGIEHIDRTGGFIPTVMIEFKAINLRVIPADDQALPNGLSIRRTLTKGFRFAFLHLVLLSRAFSAQSDAV